MRSCLNVNYQLAVAALVLTAWSSSALAQVTAEWPNSVRTWGQYHCDTEGRTGRFDRAIASNQLIAVLRSDGHVFVNGQVVFGLPLVPPAPPGLRYIDIAVRTGYGLGLLSDGSIVRWGTPLIPPAPVLPAGTNYVEIAAGGTHCLAMRSDGAVVAWTDPSLDLSGQTAVPSQLAPGSAAKLSAGDQYSLALKHDGSIVAWGDNTYGQCVVPALPPGVAYVDICAGNRHAVAVRSDGQVEAWGETTSGKCNVPPLPPGLVYLMASAGWWHSNAVRSDGVIVTWGDQSLGQGVAPQIPTGDGCIQLTSGTANSVALLRSGKVLAWGADEFLQAYVPGAPEGPRPSRYVAVGAGANHNVALTSNQEFVGWGRTDFGITQVPAALQGRRWLAVGCGYLHNVALARGGTLHAWGDNSAGQCNVPSLPPGVSYTKFVVGPGHNIAMRSDGVTVGWGDNSWGCLPIPAPPSGLSYVDADCNYGTTVLLRSDNTILRLGKPYGLSVPPPSVPPERDFVEVATTDGRFGAVLLSDGTIAHWGVSAGYWSQFFQPLPPALPFGVSYVQIEALRYSMALRRSDGRIDMLGALPSMVPSLDAELSFVELSAGDNVVTNRIGPTCTYVSFAQGCAGSRASSRLIPRDTPRIGKTLEVTLFDLPQSIAFLVFGWQQLPTPIDLGFVGMPGCDLHVSLDAIVPLVGANQQAKWQLPIPNDPIWVGTRFYNQALVLDPAAGNGFGAVVGDAAEAVIGHW